MKVNTHMVLCDITCHKNMPQNNEILSDFYASLAFLILLDYRSTLELISDLKVLLTYCRKKFSHLFLKKYFPCSILLVKSN